MSTASTRCTAAKYSSNCSQSKSAKSVCAGVTSPKGVCRAQPRARTPQQLNPKPKPLPGHSRVCQPVAQGSAHSQSWQPGVLQPHTVGPNGLTHLIHQPEWTHPTAAAGHAMPTVMADAEHAACNLTASMCGQLAGSAPSDEHFGSGNSATLGQ